MVRLLVTKGAEVDLLTQNWPALTWLLLGASYNGDCKLVKSLLDHGAQVDLQDRDGKSIMK